MQPILLFYARQNMLQKTKGPTLVINQINATCVKKTFSVKGYFNPHLMKHTDEKSYLKQVFNKSTN